MVGHNQSYIDHIQTYGDHIQKYGDHIQNRVPKHATKKKKFTAAQGLIFFFFLNNHFWAFCSLDIDMLPKSRFSKSKMLQNHQKPPQTTPNGFQKSFGMVWGGF